MAYLFLPCDAEQKKKIYKNVILNDKRKPITTPYFKFYETQIPVTVGKMIITPGGIS